MRCDTQKAEITDEHAGDIEERIMLRLRLTEGISARFLETLGKSCGRSELKTFIYENAKKIPREYLNITEEKINLTPEGFLVSNSVIGRLLGY